MIIISSFNSTSQIKSILLSIQLHDGTAMQRKRRTKKAGDPGTPPAPVSGETRSSTRPALHRTGSEKEHDNKSSPLKLFLIICAAMFGFVVILHFVSPSSEKALEEEVMKDVKLVEDEVSDFFGGGIHEKQKPPIPQQEESRDRSLSATEAMLQQDSSWVDGEKKLKQKLKVLAERQKQGKDLGVPVLTRYLGEDIPAWAGEGVDVEEWKKKVDAKYAEMAEEEKKWRERVAEFMENK